MTTEASFLKDIDRHVMEIIRDDGVNRHVRFRRPGTMCMHFDLITWPGYLCYTGDMGTYVFSRLDDMFQFFRRSKEDYAIDFRYWAEKLQAVSSSCGKGSATKFSYERFVEVIKDYRKRWIRDAFADGSLNKSQRRELWEAVEDDVLSNTLDKEEHSNFDRANDFRWSSRGKGPVEYCFADLWEHRFDEYTHRFLWCCYALAWGVRKYDEAKP